MKPKMLVLLILACATRAADVAGLSWMTGCWAGEQGAVRYEESWTRPAAGQMMGVARTIRGGKVVSHEFLLIDTDQQGAYYLPRLSSGAAPVKFRLTTQSAAEAIFENPGHDFPQRIVYRKVDGGLNARIDGKQNGKDRAVEFPMHEVACK
jgi:hypothetical protein